MTAPRVDTFLRKMTPKPHLQLLAIIAVQVIFTATLDNFAFQDEALYIHTGRWMIESWTGDIPFTIYPEAYFSGAPQLYPALAGWLDTLGGLRLVRTASLLFMCAATVFMYKAIKNMFGHDEVRRIAIFGAAAFAFCASVLFVGNFATFDAASFCALTAGLWFMTKAVQSNASHSWAVGAAVVLTLAIFLKYVSTVAVPFIFLVAFATGNVPWKQRLTRLTAIAAGMVILIGLSVLTWAAPLWDGFVRTTAGRDPIAPVSPTVLVGKLIDWVWIPAAIAVVGFVALVRHSALAAVSLLAGSLTCVGLQVLSGEDVSLQKHVVLSLIFAAPLCGYALARMSQVRLGAPLVAIALAATLLQGVSASRALFDNWPNAQPLVLAVSPLVSKDANFHILGDNPEPLMYALYDQTYPTQWSATYEGSFKYQELNGLPAYEAALRDGYFKLVILDRYTDIGKQLVDDLQIRGYRKTNEVTETRTYRTWDIYQYTR